MKIAIVDPLSSSEELSIELKRYNIKSICILEKNFATYPELLERVKPELFDDYVIVDKNDKIDDIADSLMNMNIDFIVNGYERSTEFTERLANYLTPLSANNYRTSSCRHDKVFLQDRLKCLGFPMVNYLEIKGNKLSLKNEKLLKQWQYPVIMKPANACGTLGFFECKDVNSVKQNLNYLLKDIFDEKISSYLIQEKINGIEYAVDTFSYQGKHYLIHIKKYIKISLDGIPVHRWCESISPNNPDFNALKTFMFKVLDAVELNNGFCHTELFKTDKGFFPIDLNPRLPGAKYSACIQAKLGYGFSHVDILSRVLLKQPLPQIDYQPTRVIYLHNFNPRKIGDLNIELLRKFDSYHSCIINKPSGTWMTTPKSLLDAVAYVVLTHPKLDVLEWDCEKILFYEKNGQLF